MNINSCYNENAVSVRVSFLKLFIGLRLNLVLVSTLKLLVEFNFGLYWSNIIPICFTRILSNLYDCLMLLIIHRIYT
jgi:hypothetical protein